MRVRRPEIRSWPHAPWMLGLFLAPLLHGSVNPELQPFVSALLGLSLLLLAFKLGGEDRAIVPRPLAWGAILVLLVPLLPLPAALVKIISPERWALETAFPIEAPRSWISLAISPADTVQRLWEIGFLIAAFLLARHAGHARATTRGLVSTVAVALVALAASDIYYRATGQERLLGLWESTWGKGAGTFANRNHFANWLCVGGLFVFGWWLRSVHPLHSARPDSRTGVRRNRLLGWVLLLTLGFALVMTVLSASRGGAVALLAGGTTWAILVARRSRSRRRLLSVGIVAVIGCLLFLLTGTSLLDRLAGARDQLAESYPKPEIWRQSWNLFLQFPLLGVGVGGFLKAFSHFKTQWGGSTIWHAENDAIQLATETGIIGALILSGALFLLLRAATRLLWSERSDEPELAFGAMAGLVAFLVHGLMEFVLQIPATAILAAALLGFLLGVRDGCDRTMVSAPPPRFRVVLNTLLGLLLLLAAGAQGMATHLWNDANRTSITAPGARADLVRQSLSWWPWATNRRLGLTRLQVEAASSEAREHRSSAAESIRRELNQAITLDPFNWEFRLERAWLDLAFFRATPRPRITVPQAIRINPLQAEIPLRFAAVLARRDPEWTLELLQAVDRNNLTHLRRVFQLALLLPDPPAACRQLTPDTEPALRTLAEFALDSNLPDLGIDIADQLRGRTDSLHLARLYLRAKRPDRALELLPEPQGSPQARLLIARAHLHVGHVQDAIRVAESVWQASTRRNEIEQAPLPSAAVESLRLASNRDPNDNLVARQLAERLAFEPQPDLPALRHLSNRFPRDLRMRWLVFHIERILRREGDAALSALGLAEQVLTP